MIKEHARFKKSFKSRIISSQLRKKALERIELFIQNSSHPLLRDHGLIGDLKGCRSFSISGDIRVIYTKQGEDIIFLDIGSHNQVYR